MKNKVILSMFSLCACMGVNSELCVAAEPVEIDLPTTLENLSDHELSLIASKLSDTDLRAFGAQSRRLHKIAEAEFAKRLVPMFYSHAGPVHSVFALNDGTIISVGEKDNRIYIANAKTRKYIKSLGRGTRKWSGFGVDKTIVPVNAAVFSSASNRLAIASNDGNLVVYSIGVEKNAIVFNAATPPINSLAISPDGTMIAAGIQENLLVWDLKIEHIHKETENAPIFLLAFSPDGKTLAVSLEGGLITLRDIEYYNELYSIEGSPIYLYPLFLSDGTFIVLNMGSTHNIFDVELIDPKTKKSIAPRMKTKDFDIVTDRSFALSQDGRLFAAGGKTKTVIWDVKSGKVLKEFSQKSPATTVAFSPDARICVIGYENGSIFVWQVQMGE